MNSKIFLYQSDGKLVYAWIDAHKTREELRPARVTHRAMDFLKAATEGRQPPVALTKDMMARGSYWQGYRFAIRGTDL